MKSLSYYISLFVGVLISCSNVQENQKKTPFNGEIFYPAQDLGSLFHDLQIQQVFPDGKTFVDYTPKYSVDEINADYANGIDDLKGFAEANFQRFPDIDLPAINTDNLSLEEHLPNHWPYLTRQPDTTTFLGSLLPLPEPYIVPGGRFREVYYWDSYFTMLGLAVSGRVDLIKNMVNNFAYLIETYGHIPNGNRSYYLSRSQPP